MQVYSEFCQTPELKISTKIVNGFQLFTLFLNSYTSDVWQDFEYGSQIYTFKENFTSGRAADQKFPSDLGKY